MIFLKKILVIRIKFWWDLDKGIVLTEVLYRNGKYVIRNWRKGYSFFKVVKSLVDRCLCFNFFGR